MTYFSKAPFDQDEKVKNKITAKKIYFYQQKIYLDELINLGQFVEAHELLLEMRHWSISKLSKYLLDSM